MAPEPTATTNPIWNTRSSLEDGPYAYSKTVAERAAWDFIETEERHFDLVVTAVWFDGSMSNSTSTPSPQKPYRELSGGFAIDTSGEVRSQRLTRAFSFARSPAGPDFAI